MDNTDNQSLSGVGPGKALRQARLDLRLNPEDVAAQLHLAARQIVALEADDYANLPQATYVRGYLRSYALLLGLTPDPILESYARLAASDKPQRLAREGSARPNEDRDAQVRSASLIVGALVLVLAIAWWQGRDDFETTTPTQLPPGDVVRAPAADAPAVSSAPLSETTETAPARESAVIPPPEPTVAPADRVRPPVATPPPPVVAKPTPPVAVAKPAPASNLPRARLVINAEQESWVDIRDAQENRLLYETIPAGRIVALEGVPPFAVFLGHVDGVSVSVNGQPYDALKHKRGTTARFSVGGKKRGSGAPPADVQAEPQAPPPSPSPAPSPTAPPAAPLEPGAGP